LIFLIKVSGAIFASTGIDKSIELKSFPRARLDGVERRVQVDAFISTSRDMHSSHKKGDPHVDDVGVVIELKKSSDSDTPAKYSLLKYIEQVITNQPNRIVVHGMTLAGGDLRFYVFDRGSVYQSCAYNIFNKPDILIRALIGFQQMDAGMMGFDTSIENVSENVFKITVGKSVVEVKPPLERAPGIFTRATTIWPLLDESGFVKDCWPVEECRGHEAKYLHTSVATFKICLTLTSTVRSSLLSNLHKLQKRHLIASTSEKIYKGMTPQTRRSPPERTESITA
jgi:hypothetical protein